MLKISNGICLVKFSATWCAPCKVAGITIKKVLDLFPGINFIEIDVDDEPDLSKEYKIASVPTVIIFKDNIQKDVIIGSFNADLLIKKLKGVLQND